MVEEDTTNEVWPEVSEEEEAKELRQALAKEKQKAESYLANWQRAQADFINYKRRNEQENEETRKFANSILMLNLLPILDDWERAIASVTPRLSNHKWVDGIKLIGRKLLASLQIQGLSQIEALGKPFDPRFHEAVMQGEGEEGIIIQELQKGYKFHDRVIRPSKVVVGNGGKDKEKEE